VEPYEAVLYMGKNRQRVPPPLGPIKYLPLAVSARIGEQRLKVMKEQAARRLNGGDVL
jgi:hypothetical protein